MRVLVTGSSGFVGRHLATACAARGWIVDRVDIAQYLDAREFFRWHDLRYDLVLHCAAIVGGRRVIDGNPAGLLAHNMQLDGALFEWALRTNPGQIVYYSSSAAYPDDLQTGELACPLVEHNIDLSRLRAPETAYGQGKLAGEHLVSYARAAGLRVHVLRPFSGYGTDQDLDYPFPSFIDRAKRRCDPFDIWGDGTQVRDWIHIDDIVGATLAAADSGREITANLCTGIGTDFTTLAKMVTEEAGYAPQLNHITTATRGVSYRVGDPTRMHSFYTPTVTLAQGISRALHPTDRVLSPDQAARFAQFVKAVQENP